MLEDEKSSEKLQHTGKGRKALRQLQNIEGIKLKASEQVDLVAKIDDAEMQLISPRQRERRKTFLKNLLAIK